MIDKKINIDILNDYILQLEDVRKQYFESSDENYEFYKSKLIDKIIEVVNIYDGIIPNVSEAIWLRNYSEYRDIQSVLGILKWYKIKLKKDKRKINKFIKKRIEIVKSNIAILENSSPEEYIDFENNLFDEISITLNIFSEELYDLKDLLLFNQGSGIRDANTVIGKLRLNKYSSEELESEKLDQEFLIHASNIIGDTSSGLTGAEIIRLTTKYAVKFGVKIPITNSDFSGIVPNKRTALLNNINVFSGIEQFQILSELIENDKFKDNKEIADLKISLFKIYGSRFNVRIRESDLIIEVEHWLEPFQQSFSLYDSALTKYEENVYFRNILDDLRLSFELLLKQLLNNNKSLEKQINALGTTLKEKGVSVQIRNLISQVLMYYTNYQNDNVKHNDTSKNYEIEYIIEQTSVLMKFLIKILDDKNDTII